MAKVDASDPRTKAAAPPETGMALPPGYLISEPYDSAPAGESRPSQTAVPAWLTSGRRQFRLIVMFALLAGAVAALFLSLRGLDRPGQPRAVPRSSAVPREPAPAADQPGMHLDANARLAPAVLPVSDQAAAPPAASEASDKAVSPNPSPK